MNGIRDLKYQYIDDSVDPGAKYASAEKLGEGSVVVRPTHLSICNANTTVFIYPFIEINDLAPTI